MLSITITFPLSRRSAQRALLITEDSRNKSISIFIISGLEPFGITLAATSCRPQRAKASCACRELSPRSQFCLTPAHSRKIKVPDPGQTSHIWSPVPCNASDPGGLLLNQEESIYRGMFSWPHIKCHWLYTEHHFWLIFPRNSWEAYAFNPVQARRLSEISRLCEEWENYNPRLLSQCYSSLSWGMTRNSF